MGQMNGCLGVGPVNEGMKMSAMHFRGLTGYSVQNGMEFERRNASSEISEKAGPRAMMSG